MKTNTESLQAALTYWNGQHDIAKFTTTYVVASPTGLRVLANNMAVMIAGCSLPQGFSVEAIAQAHAQNLVSQPLGFDDEAPLEVMTYQRFCEIQIARFEVALHTVRVADAMAYTMAAA